MNLSLLFVLVLLGHSAPADSTFGSDIDAVPILLQWLKGQDLGKPGSAALRDQLRAGLPGEKHLPEDLQSLALRGFDFLGTNGAAALPQLRVLAYAPLSDLSDAALDAMISIGEPAWPTATNLAQNAKSYLRRKGAYLLGAIRSHPETSVPILLKLIDDPDPAVSSAAFTALAEFPSNEVPLIIREKLADPNSSLDAAYAMHSRGTNAMQWLIDTCQASSNWQVRLATLGALAFRELPIKTEEPPEPRRTAYHRKWCDYCASSQSLGIGFLHRRDLDQEAFVAAIKSNFVHHQEARVRQTASNFLAKTTTGSESVKFLPGRIPGRYFRGFFIAGGDSITILTNGTFRFSRSGCMVGAVSEARGRVDRDGDTIKLTEESRSVPPRGMDVEESLGSYNRLYPVFWDQRTYLVPTKAMARFCAAVNAGYEPRVQPSGDYLVATENWTVPAKGVPEVPDAWKGYVLMNQIQGKVWHSISTKEAWINLGKRQGVLPGMMLFCYDPSGSAPYVRVPEVRVVEVLQERSRVTVAAPNFDGLYGGLVVASGRLPASR